jgi:hypothetical protein
MTTTHTTTAQQIIDDAYTLIGKKDMGASLEWAEVEYGLRLLNDLIKQWQTKGVRLQTVYDMTVTIVAAKASYTVSATGDVVLARPDRIISALRRDSDNDDTPVDVVSMEDYRRLSIKASPGQTTMIAYAKTTDSGTVYVWPVEDAVGASLILAVQRQIDKFDDTEDAGDFPSEMFLALKFGLAALLDNGVGRTQEERRTLKIDALTYFSELQATDQETTSFFFQPLVR